MPSPVAAAAAEETPPVSPAILQVASPPISPRVKPGPKKGYRIIQWNIKFLTNTVAKRIENISTTLFEIDKNFAACVIEEVKCGGGEEAVKEIVSQLNKKYKEWAVRENAKRAERENARRAKKENEIRAKNKKLDVELMDVKSDIELERSKYSDDEGERIATPDAEEERIMSPGIEEEEYDPVDPVEYVYAFTDVVNPDKVQKELTAIIWNRHRLGDIGYSPNHLILPEDDNTFKVGNTTITCELSKAIWDVNKRNFDDKKKEKPKKYDYEVKPDDKKKEKEVKPFPCMDYKAALFSFHPPEFTLPFHIIGVHLSPNSEQNYGETIFLQEFLYKMAEKCEYIIFLGDMNVDQCDIYRMWYKEEELTTEYDIQNLKPIKDNFFKHYKRVINKDLPTNLFPFLAGAQSKGSHNDDIWIPKKLLSPFILPPENYGKDRPRHDDKKSGTGGGIFTPGSKRPAQIHKIPLSILNQWDVETRKFFDETGKKMDQKKVDNLDEKTDDLDEKTKKEKKLTIKNRFDRSHKLTNMLMNLWSDHRPVSANLQYTPPDEDLLQQMQSLKIYEDLAYTIIKETPYDISDDASYGFHIDASEIEFIDVTRTMIEEYKIKETQADMCWDFIMKQKIPDLWIPKKLKIGEQFLYEDMISDKLKGILILNPRKTNYYYKS